MMPVNPKPKICERCNHEFGCSANSSQGCWCYQLKIPAVVQEELRVKYHDCLCPECLDHLILESEKPQ